jgi:hypothetical protein
MAEKKDDALYVGPSHAENGIPVVIDSQRNVEVEGMEYKICSQAYMSDEHLSFKDKTNLEILDFIHTKFNCKFEQPKADSNDFIICKLAVRDLKSYDRSGTVREILDEIQGDKGCKLSTGQLGVAKTLEEGGKLSYFEIKKPWEVPYEKYRAFIRNPENKSKTLMKFTDETLDKATDLQLYHFINMSHPDELGYKVTRAGVIAEYRRRGGYNSALAIGWPVDIDYPYENVHTSNIEALYQTLDIEYRMGEKEKPSLEEFKNSDGSWFSLFEHWRPVFNPAETEARITEKIKEKEELLSTFTKKDKNRASTLVFDIKNLKGDLGLLKYFSDKGGAEADSAARVLENEIATIKDAISFIEDPAGKAELEKYVQVLIDTLFFLQPDLAPEQEIKPIVTEAITHLSSGEKGYFELSLRNRDLKLNADKINKDASHVNTMTLQELKSLSEDMVNQKSPYDNEYGSNVHRIFSAVIARIEHLENKLKAIIGGAKKSTEIKQILESPTKEEKPSTESKLNPEIVAILDKLRKGKFSTISEKEIDLLDDAIGLIIAFGGIGDLTKAGVTQWLENMKEDLLLRTFEVMPEYLTEKEKKYYAELGETRSKKDDDEKQIEYNFLRDYGAKFGEMPTRYIKYNEVMDELEIYPSGETKSDGEDLFRGEYTNDGLLDYVHGIAIKDKKNLNPRSVEILQHHNVQIIGFEAMPQKEQNPHEQTLTKKWKEYVDEKNYDAIAKDDTLNPNNPYYLDLFKKATGIELSTSIVSKEAKKAGKLKEYLNQQWGERGESREDFTFTYKMLSRLQSDCDYYLGYGNRSDNGLWAENAVAQIEEMKRLWNSLPADKKPEWLSMQDIINYEKKMVGVEGDDEEKIDLTYPKNLIAKMTPDENRLLLPTTIRFSAKEYTDLKRELIKAGGVYKKNAFVFEEPAADVFDRILKGEEYALKKKVSVFSYTN